MIQLGTGETSIQNTNGLLFFISNLIGMASISGSILTCKIQQFLSYHKHYFFL